jgi:hypothetical protein
MNRLRFYSSGVLVYKKTDHSGVVFNIRNSTTLTFSIFGEIFSEVFLLIKNQFQDSILL